MKFSETIKYIDALQSTCDVIFDETENDVRHLLQGLSYVYDQMDDLKFDVALEESMQSDAQTKWSLLISLNSKKCEQSLRLSFVEVTREDLNQRLNTIYQKFPILKRIDEMLCGLVPGNNSLYDEIYKLGLIGCGQPYGLTKCNDLMDIFLEKRGDILNLYTISNTIDIDSSKDASVLPNELDTNRGRPKEPQIPPLKNLLNGSENERKNTLTILHDLINGKKGKQVAFIIYACVQAGKMSKPTYTQLYNEFGSIGDKSGFNRYYKDASLDCYKNEIDLLKMSFK